MKRARRIREFWGWLPAFRAVAEGEHVGHAAADLGVSPPAVSRAVSLLEAELGVELFERRGRGLALTDAGRVFHAAVRDAMRTVDEGLVRITSDERRGALRVSSVSPLTETLLAPALGRLKEAHPGLTVEVTDAPLQDVARALSRGELDVAFLRSELAPEGLSVTRLGEMPLSIYAPLGSEVAVRLGARRRVSFDDLSTAPFVGLTGRHGNDPLPRSVAKLVLGRADGFQQAMAMARALRALVVLPESLGERAVLQGEFTRLSAPPLPALVMVVAARPRLGSLKTPADLLVDALGPDCGTNKPDCGNNKPDCGNN